MGDAPPLKFPPRMEKSFSTVSELFSDIVPSNSSLTSKALSEEEVFMLMFEFELRMNTASFSSGRPSPPGPFSTTSQFEAVSQSASPSDTQNFKRKIFFS